jgi:hypothetical protein
MSSVTTPYGYSLQSCEELQRKTKPEQEKKTQELWKKRISRGESGAFQSLPEVIEDRILQFSGPLYGEADRAAEGIIFGPQGIVYPIAKKREDFITTKRIVGRLINYNETFRLHASIVGDDILSPYYKISDSSPDFSSKWTNRITSNSIRGDDFIYMTSNYEELSEQGGTNELQKIQREMGINKQKISEISVYAAAAGRERNELREFTRLDSEFISEVSFL